MTRAVRRISAAVAVTLVTAVSAAGAATPVLTGHSGWFWGSPTPQGKTLYRVAFDRDTGYAVGAFGTVLRSDDDGHSWTGLVSGTVHSLTGVDELDPSTAIVSGGCTVAETTDAGATFRVLPQLGGRSCGGGVVATAFTGASQGYVALGDGEILSTDDAGRTLQAREPVPGGGTTDIAFTSAADGIAVTGRGLIKRTTDGARSWTTVAEVATDLYSIDAVTPQLVYAVGSSEQTPGGPGGGVLLRSQDGGATWSTLPLATATPAGGLVRISCVDALRCVITTYDGALLRTEDGGQTATAIAPNGVQNRDDTPAESFGNHTGGVDDAAYAASGHVVTVGPSGAVLVSDDDAASFQPLLSHAQVGVSAAATTPLRVGASPDDADVAGTHGRILTTSDGGESWSAIQVPSAAAVVDTAFPTPAVGYELGRDGVLRTTHDAGASWRLLDAGVDRRAQLAAVDDDTIVLAGPRGLRRSADGGASLRPVRGSIVLAPHRAPTSLARLALSHLQGGGRRLVAWGPTAAVETTDGGRRWRAIPLPRDTAIDGLSFVSASRGWIGTTGGELLATRDRGATWRDVRSLGDSTAGDFAFADARHGYVIASRALNRRELIGDLLVTTDGGRSWRPQIVDGTGDDARDDVAVAAAPGRAYLLDSEPGIAGVGPGRPSLFATSDAGASPESASLTFTARPSRTGDPAAGDRLSIRGRLRPAPGPGGSRAVVDERRPGGVWRTRRIVIASDGAFQSTQRRPGGRTDIVVYVPGDGRLGGAGAYHEVTAPAGDRPRPGESR